MAKNKNIPEKLINYSVYKDGSAYIGTADVTLPSITRLTTTTTGAGISGEIDSPTIGQYSSMELTMNFNTFMAEYFNLLDGNYHLLDLRLAQQVMDRSSGNVDVEGWKVTVKAAAKTGDLGSLAPNSTIGNNIGFEVTYIKVTYNGERVLEIDKLNGVDYIAGTDNGKKIRDLLGL